MKKLSLFLITLVSFNSLAYADCTYSQVAPALLKLVRQTVPAALDSHTAQLSKNVAKYSVTTSRQDRELRVNVDEFIFGRTKVSGKNSKDIKVLEGKLAFACQCKSTGILPEEGESNLLECKLDYTTKRSKVTEAVVDLFSVSLNGEFTRTPSDADRNKTDNARVVLSLENMDGKTIFTTVRGEAVGSPKSSDYFKTVQKHSLVELPEVDYDNGE